MPALSPDETAPTEKLADGGGCWTMPSGRQYVTEPTRYPI